MKKYKVEVKGVSPYLMHRFGVEGADTKTQKKVGKKDYKGEVENALYKSPDGEIYVPATQLKGSLMEAGKQMRVVGKGKATYSKLFGAVVIIEPDTIPMSPQKWEIDERAVVIQRTRIIRYRPKFKDWSLKFNVVVMDDDISLEVVKEGLDIAGNYCGIGDFRPQKKGSYGRFIVTSFKEVTK